MSALFSPASLSMKWRTIAIFTLAFWISSSLILDFVVMPGLYVTGMMQAPGFAIAGYSIFWLFNRVELLCAALLLTGTLVLWQSSLGSLVGRRVLAIAGLLLAIPMMYTYLCTPMMSELGITLDWFSTAASVPPQMTQMHSLYFGLEMLKLVLGIGLLRHFYGDRPMPTAQVSA